SKDSMPCCPTMVTTHVSGEDIRVGMPIMPPSFRYPPPQPHAVKTSTAPMAKVVRTSQPLTQAGCRMLPEPVVGNARRGGAALTEGVTGFRPRNTALPPPIPPEPRSPGLSPGG